MAGSIEPVPIQVSSISVFDGRPECRISLASDEKVRDGGRNTFVQTWRPASSAIDPLQAVPRSIRKRQVLPEPAISPRLIGEALRAPLRLSVETLT